MKWEKTDLSQYKEAKEYVDTLIIPLVPFQLSNDKTYEKEAFQSDVLALFVNKIEKELTGRVMLVPSYNYVSSKETEWDHEIERLNTWIQNCKIQPFQHTFLVTFDTGWKKNEADIDGSLLWFPGIDNGDIQSTEMQSLIKNQVNQIVELIRSYW